MRTQSFKIALLGGMAKLVTYTPLPAGESARISFVLIPPAHTDMKVLFVGYT